MEQLREQIPSVTATLQQIHEDPTSGKNYYSLLWANIHSYSVPYTCMTLKYSNSGSFRKAVGAGSAVWTTSTAHTSIV